MSVCFPPGPGGKHQVVDCSHVVVSVSMRVQELYDGGDLGQEPARIDNGGQGRGTNKWEDHSFGSVKALLALF